MTKGSFRGLAILCVMAAAIAVPRTAEAQAQAARSGRTIGGYLNMHFGVAWPAEATFTSGGEVSFGPEFVETVKINYPLNTGPSVEIGGGLVIHRRWIVGAAWSFASSTAPGDLTLELTHLPTHGLITDTTGTAPFDRKENSLHIQGGVLLPMGKTEVMLFGGPSMISVSHQAVYDLTWTDSLVQGEWTANIVNAWSEPRSASAWGFNVGGDVSYAVNSRVSLGGQVRYSRATVNMEDPIASLAASFLNEEPTKVNKDYTVGGLAVLGGVRIKF